MGDTRGGASRRVSTRTRFEVFKRDGFACRYCGRTQNDDGVTLHIDHVVPVSAGGSDEIINLVTACQDCNLGKSAKLLGEIRPEIDLDAAAREIKEREEKIRAYNAANAARAQREEDDYIDAYNHWFDVWGENSLPRYLIPYTNTLRRAVADIGAEAVKECMDITARRFTRLSLDACRYFGGVLKRKRAEIEGRVVPCSYCGKRIVLDVGEDPTGTWTHTSCIEQRAHDEAEDEYQAAELARAHAAQAAADEWYFHADEIEVEISSWDKLAEEAGF